MVDFKIVNYREGESPEGNTCIGCGVCAGLDSEGKYWVMDEKEPKVNLVDGKETKKGVFERKEEDAEKSDLELNKDAAEQCPVNVIKVEEV